MASSDVWEWQHILDGITDTGHAKRLLAALGGLYVSLATAAVQGTGIDVANWLHGLAVEQIDVAKRIAARCGLLSAPQR